MSKVGQRLIQAAQEANDIAQDTLLCAILTDREKGTPPECGSWLWQGTPDNLSLATAHCGRRYVMDFARKGMQAAQPRFQIRGVMYNAADDLVQFVVGDGTARGHLAGKSDDTVYRYDVAAIDHPDARRIARVPEMEARILSDKDEIKRLRDGLEAIAIYGGDTLGGPADPAQDTREWQRASVSVMTARAESLLAGEAWDD